MKAWPGLRAVRAQRLLVGPPGEYSLQTVLEAALFGMAGVSASTAWPWPRLGAQVTLVDDHGDRLAAVQADLGELGLPARFVSTDEWSCCPFPTMPLTWPELAGALVPARPAVPAAGAGPRLAAGYLYRHANGRRLATCCANTCWSVALSTTSTSTGPTSAASAVCWKALGCASSARVSWMCRPGPTRSCRPPRC